MAHMRQSRPDSGRDGCTLRCRIFLQVLLCLGVCGLRFEVPLYKTVHEMAHMTVHENDQPTVKVKNLVVEKVDMFVPLPSVVEDDPTLLTDSALLILVYGSGCCGLPRRARI